MLYDKEVGLPYYHGTTGLTFITLWEDLDTKGGQKYWQIVDSQAEEEKTISAQTVHNN